MIEILKQNDQSLQANKSLQIVYLSYLWLPIKIGVTATESVQLKYSNRIVSLIE